MFLKYGFALLLSLVAGGGFFARGRYLSRDYFSPDEPVARAVLDHLREPGQWDTNWRVCGAPAPYDYDQFTFSSYHYALYGWDRITCAFPRAEVARLRLLNAFLGVISVVCVGLAGRTLLGRLGGVAAAAFVAVAPVLVQDAHYLRCESFLTAGAAIILFLSSSLRSCGWAAVAGGGVLGVLLACKVSALLLAPILLPLIVAQPRGILRSGLLVSLGAAAGFALGVPSALPQLDVYLDGIVELQRQYANALPPHTTPDLAPSFPRAIEYFWKTFGPAFWGLAAVGAVGLVLRRECRLRVLCLLGALGLSLWAFGGKAAFIERSYSPFIPLVAILFGAGITSLGSLLESKLRLGRVLRLVLSGLGLVCGLSVPLVYSVEIVEYGFSCRERETAIQLLQDIKRQHSEAKVFYVSCIDDDALAETHRKIDACETTILAIGDYYDSASKQNIARLTAGRERNLLYVRDSRWAELPTCTLHTFFSARIWVIQFPPVAAGEDASSLKAIPVTAR